MGEPTRRQIDEETTRVARAAGCDRGFFTVCWGEHEKGLECRCKTEAVENLRAALLKASPGGTKDAG